MEDGEAGDIGHLAQAPLGRNPEGDLVLILHQRMEEPNVLDQALQKQHVLVSFFAFLSKLYTNQKLNTLMTWDTFQ